MALGIMLVLAIALTTVITFTAAGARDSHRVNAGQKAYCARRGRRNNALAVLNANYATDDYDPGKRCLLNPRRRRPASPARSRSFPAGDARRRSRASSDSRGRTTVVVGADPVRRMRLRGQPQSRTRPGLGSPGDTRTTAIGPSVPADGSGTGQELAELALLTTNATAAQLGHDRVALLHARQPPPRERRRGPRAALRACVKPPLPVPTIATPCPSTAGKRVDGKHGRGLPGRDGRDRRPSTQTSPSNTVGTNAKRISQAHIVNGCESKTRAYNVSCEWDQHDVFVTGNLGDRIMPPVPVPNPPVVDWPFWYQYGSPGPTWGCDSGTTPMLDQQRRRGFDGWITKRPAPNRYSTSQHELLVQDPLRRADVGRPIEDAHGQGHDLHRRQRQGGAVVGRPGRGPLSGPGHDLHVGVVSDEEREALRGSRGERQGLQLRDERVEAEREGSYLRGEEPRHRSGRPGRRRQQQRRGEGLIVPGRDQRRVRHLQRDHVGHPGPGN